MYHKVNRLGVMALSDWLVKMLLADQSQLSLRGWGGRREEGKGGVWGRGLRPRDQTIGHRKMREDFNLGFLLNSND